MGSEMCIRDSHISSGDAPVSASCASATGAIDIGENMLSRNGSRMAATGAPLFPGLLASVSLSAMADILLLPGHHYVLNRTENS